MNAAAWTAEALEKNGALGREGESRHAIVVVTAAAAEIMGCRGGE